MEIKARTEGKAIQVVLSFLIKKPTVLYITALNDKRANTVYIRNNKYELAEGVQPVLLNFPLSPADYVVIKITPDNGGWELVGMSSQRIPESPVMLDALGWQFLRFVEEFAHESGDTDTGMYGDNGGKFFINFMPQMYDEREGYLDTPAQIEHNTGEMQVAKKFWDNLTVPARVQISMHEWFHFHDDETIEKEVDLRAAAVTMPLGYPRQEILYAITKIIPSEYSSGFPIQENRERANAMFRFINSYS